MANTFPIALGWNNVPTDVTYVDINQLGTIIAQQLQASVATSVSFFVSGPTDPLTNTGALFYNTTQNAFKFFSTITGNWQPIQFLIVATLPVTNNGLVYLTTTNLFYFWNGSAYSAVSQFEVGDIKFSYTSTDDLGNGWVLAAGSRTIDSITAMTTNQNANAHTLFGAGALIQIPNLTAPTSTVGGGGGGGGTCYGFIYLGNT